MRITPLVNGEIYHVFNRGINRQPTFYSRRDYRRALLTIRFYRLLHPPQRLSDFLQTDSKKRETILANAEKHGSLVTVLAFCLMPNHFHLLLRQETDNGISKFMGNFQNSYTRYFNTRHQRDGAIFLTQFKAVRMETEDQLLHVSRYIHLNPYSSYIVKTQQQLLNYPWSSLNEYLNPAQAIISQPEVVLSSFKNPRQYQQFVLDQADYQRRLEEIKHLTLE